MECRHCQKICKSLKSQVQHEIRCPENLDRTAVGFTSSSAKTSGSGSKKNTENLVKFNSLRKLDNSAVFVVDSSYPRHRLKERIQKENIIEYVCSSCRLGDCWNGTILVLQLDHINGKNDDNQIENLRFLCPNCHSQQATYAAKNRVFKRSTSH